MVASVRSTGKLEVRLPRMTCCWELAAAAAAAAAAACWLLAVLLAVVKFWMRPVRVKSGGVRSGGGVFLLIRGGCVRAFGRLVAELSSLVNCTMLNDEQLGLPPRSGSFYASSCDVFRWFRRANSHCRPQLSAIIVYKLAFMRDATVSTVEFKLPAVKIQ